MNEVAAALIRNPQGYLIAKRKDSSPWGSFWEFPGGKRHSGETLPDCLRREMREEMGVEVEVGELVHEALFPDPHGAVVLYFYNCTILNGAPRALGCQEFRWVAPKDLPGYAFPPANRALIAELADP